MPSPVRHSLLILGGSSPYTLLLIRALIESGLMNRFHQITLFGRNQSRLRFLTAVANALAAKAELECVIDHETDLERCAGHRFDIVFNQIRFGGLAKRDLDERVAIECGLPADETLGIVGASNAIRAISGLAGYTEAFLGVRHRPIWVNFTNPCSIVTQYLTGRLDTEVIGICDYPVLFQRQIATFLSARPASVQVRYFGLNHFAFVYDVTVDGQPVLQSLLDNSEGFGTAIAAQRHLEFLVVPTWNFVFDPAGIWARQRGRPNRASQLLKIESEFDAHASSGQCAAQRCFEVLGRRECEWYELAVAPLLAMCLSETPGEAIVNVPMDDVFALGMTNTVVESNALVSSSGARALPLPAHVRRSPLFDYCRAAKRAENALLHGIMQRDCSAIIQACAMTPLIAGADRIVRYFDVLRAGDPDMERILGREAVPRFQYKQHG